VKDGMHVRLPPTTVGLLQCVTIPVGTKTYPNRVKVKIYPLSLLADEYGTPVQQP